MRIKVTGKQAQITERETFTIGSVGILIGFEFSTEWDGLTKTAQFYNGGKPLEQLIFNNSVELPAEMALEKKPVSLCIIGKNDDGTIVFPSVECALGSLWYGIREGAEKPQKPAPDWQAQIESGVNNAVNTAKDVERRANEGEFDGEPGGYYTVSASADGEYLVLTWAPSREDMEQLPPQKVKVEIPGVKPEEIAKAVEDYLLANPIEIPVASVNGKTGAVVLTAADVKADPAGTARRLVDGLVIPNVPAWAMKPQKPTYTASEVGAEKAGAVSAHNVSKQSHEDIRLLIADLTRRIDAFFDSDDQTLDQLSEIVEYIKSNKGLIDSITTGKVNVSDIVDNLTTNVKNKPLSAAMGVELKRLIDNIKSGTMNHAELTGRDAENQHPMSAITGLDAALGKKLSNEEAIPSGLLPLASMAEAGAVKVAGVGAPIPGLRAYQLRMDLGGHYSGVAYVQIPPAEELQDGVVRATPSYSIDGVLVEINNNDRLLRVPHDTQKLDATALPSAIETALAQAKASGAFDGKDGKTPEKGTDYFTSADKQELVGDVLAALPKARGVDF